MKLLFDQNSSFRIERQIDSIFSNSKHCSNLGLLNTDDTVIWEFAKNNDYAVVTFDSDFYDIRLLKGTPPKIIWIRKGNLTTKKNIETLEDKRSAIKDFLTNPDKKEIACLEIN
jgi:predicted nuclease of predicted toxin-antitoxin system